MSECIHGVSFQAPCGKCNKAYKAAKAQVPIIVLAHGTFDYLHLGHLKYLEAGKVMGDKLIVSLTADAFVNKGPRKPLYNENQRAEMLRALRCVDEVEICHHKTALPMIEKYRPQIYLKGEDYKTTDKHGSLILEKKAVEKYGGKLVITSGLPRFSSTMIHEALGIR